MVISILSFINLLSIGNFLNVPFSFFLFFFSSGERLIPSSQANKEKKSLSSKFLLSLDRVHDFSPLLFALPSLFRVAKKKKKKREIGLVGEDAVIQLLLLLLLLFLWWYIDGQIFYLIVRHCLNGSTFRDSFFDETKNLSRPYWKAWTELMRSH